MLVVPWILTFLKGPAHPEVVVGEFVMGLAMGALDVGEVVIGAALCTDAKTMLAMIDKVQSMQS